MTANHHGPPPRKHPDAASRVYEGEAFIVLPHSHEYKILNKVGTRVWELIDGERTVSDIARAIEEEYEVSYETALEDVHQFIGELSAHGMLASGEAGKVA